MMSGPGGPLDGDGSSSSSMHGHDDGNDARVASMVSLPAPAVPVPDGHWGTRGGEGVQIGLSSSWGDG